MCFFSCPQCLLIQCCFCIPLREGCVTSGVLMLVARLFSLFILVAAPGYDNVPQSVFAGVVLEALTIVTCLNAFPYVYGVLQENLRSLFLYISLELAYYPINGVYRVYFLAYHINKGVAEDNRLSLRYLLAMVTFSGVEAYLIWLACSFYITVLRKKLLNRPSRQ